MSNTNSHDRHKQSSNQTEMSQWKISVDAVLYGHNRNHEKKNGQGGGEKTPLKRNVTRLKGKRNEVSVTKTSTTVACKSIRKFHSASIQFYEGYEQLQHS